jgi:5-methylcytosine-specific restriction endonuclease McrA
VTNVWYQGYLRTEHWQRVRHAALERAGSCCEFCGTAGFFNDEDQGDPHQLHVHHLTYETLWYEQPWDLIVLCGSCHADVHEFPQRAEQVAAFASRRGFAA